MTDDKKDKKKFTPLLSDNVNDELIPEEFPDGPLGSPINQFAPVELKSTPWRKGQKQMSSYDYPDTREQEYVPRNYPISDPLRDE